MLRQQGIRRSTLALASVIPLMSGGIRSGSLAVMLVSFRRWRAESGKPLTSSERGRRQSLSGSAEAIGEEIKPRIETPQSPSP